LLISFWILKLDFLILTKHYLQNQELRRILRVKSAYVIFKVIVEISINLLITKILQRSRAEKYL
jgi:hypothetical protein